MFNTPESTGVKHLLHGSVWSKHLASTALVSCGKCCCRIDRNIMLRRRNWPRSRTSFKLKLTAAPMRSRFISLSWSHTRPKSQLESTSPLFSSGLRQSPESRAKTQTSKPEWTSPMFMFNKKSLLCITSLGSAWWRVHGTHGTLMNSPFLCVCNLPRHYLFKFGAPMLIFPLFPGNPMLQFKQGFVRLVGEFLSFLICLL